MAKLFVGQIPKSMVEDQLMPLFQQYGTIMELSVIRDKMTGAHKGMNHYIISPIPLSLILIAGCAFLTYTNKEEANACITGLHNKHTLPGVCEMWTAVGVLISKQMPNALQVKYSVSQAGSNHTEHQGSNPSYRNSGSGYS